MISLNLKNAFNDMDIEDKKNKINEELLFIGELIKRIELFCNLDCDFQIKNYVVDAKLSEDETLTFLYEDIFEIQKQLLLIVNAIQNTDKSN